MKIIIVGAGEVGTHLSKMLAKENEDIILMDPNKERLNFPNNMEIMTVEGNATSIADLKSTGIDKSDMFIAVTPSESVNMTACMLATNLGAKKTIARISNTEYLTEENSNFFSKLGVDSLICPEVLAAREIVNSLNKPWTKQWWELCGGAIILIGSKVREDAPIVNKYLYELSYENKVFHIVAIKRGNYTIIPKGSDNILPEDIVFFTTTKDHIDDVQKLAGKEDINIKKVSIMGGSRIALKVAEFLSKNIRIKILEKDKDKCYKIADQVSSNVMVINGDGRDSDLLSMENITSCDAFIALTENAETNILACLSAKTWGVKKTVAKVENIDYIQMAEKLDIGAVINKKLIAASHIYQFMLNADISNIKSLAFANANVVELVARKDSKITSKPVKDLNFPKDITLGGLIRDNKANIIDGETRIIEGDHVIVFCLEDSLRKIEDLFN